MQVLRKSINSDDVFDGQLRFAQFDPVPQHHEGLLDRPMEQGGEGNQAEAPVPELRRL